MKISNKLFILVIGAQKAGTTSLHNLLLDHARISLPRIKETHFFSNEEKFKKGEGWYFKQFDVRKDIMCEIDPSYLFYQCSPKRIKETIKNPKFIIIFRKPIDRALSHYLMSYYRGHEELSFIDALRSEPKRLKDIDNDFSLIHHSYIKRGNYSEQLNRYLIEFDKKDFLFIKFEDLISKENRKKTIYSIVEFMEIKNEDILFKMKHNNRRKKIKYEFIRDLLYKDNIIRTAVKKIISSDLLRIRLKEMINFLNSSDYDSNNKFSNNILDSIPQKYFIWNNKQSKLLGEMTDLDTDNWIY